MGQAGKHEGNARNAQTEQTIQAAAAHTPSSPDDFVDIMRTKGEARFKQIVKASIVGIVANVALAAGKAAVGFAAGSIAIVLDALNSLTDAFASVATIVGQKIACMRPSRKHPYGFGRAEYLTSVVIAAIIIAAGVISMKGAIQKIITPNEPNYTAITLAVLVASIAVKVLLAFIYIKKGDQIKSQPLKASGIDALYDAILTGGALIAALICIWWHIDVDGWMGAIISVFVIKAGVDVLREAMASIIGERPDSEKVKEIRSIIADHDEVLGVYDLMVDTFGPEAAYAACHIEVPGQMTAFEIHELTRGISEELEKKCDTVAILGIYAANSTGQYAGIRQKLRSLAEADPSILQVHGFFVDQSAGQIDFDIVVDFGANADAVRDNLVKQMKASFPDYTYNVVCDIDYSGVPAKPKPFKKA